MQELETGRRVAKLAIAAVCTAAAALLASILPGRIHEARCRSKLDAADALARSGPAESALEAYERIEMSAPRGEIADRAAHERARLEAYVRAAADLKRRADEAFKNGDYEEALTLYRRLAKDFPLSRRAAAALSDEPNALRFACEKLDSQGKAAFAAKQWDQAKALYQRLLALDANYPGAEAALRTAARNLADFHARCEEAAARESAGDWPAARRAYEEALRLMPTSAAAYEGRTRALMGIPPPPGMVLILPGEFIIGADDGEPDEMPVRKLKSDGFYMDATEVTNAEYAKFVAETGRKPPPHWGSDRPGVTIADMPVVCVTWEEAAAYAAWAGKRLPTEAEWERAARGRNGRRYPWGDTFNGTEAAFGGGPVRAGDKPTDRSEEGCLNMGGNVSEWTADEVPAPTQQPKADSTSRVSWRAVRGASWAGLERDRPLHIVPAGLASPSSDPKKTVLIDKPGVHGVEAAMLCEVEFFFRGLAEGSPLIEIRRWLPEVQRLVTGNFLIRPGQEIAGERLIPLGIEPDAPTLRVRLETGCRLLKLENVDDPLKGHIVYADPDGNQRIMLRTFRRDHDLPLVPQPAPEDEAWKAYDRIVREVARRPLGEAARSANRMSAPQNARYVNVGFRCAKDLD